MINKIIPDCWSAFPYKPKMKLIRQSTLLRLIDDSCLTGWCIHDLPSIAVTLSHALNSTSHKINTFHVVCFKKIKKSLWFVWFIYPYWLKICFMGNHGILVIIIDINIIDWSKDTSHNTSFRWLWSWHYVYRQASSSNNNIRYWYKSPLPRRKLCLFKSRDSNNILIDATANLLRQQELI